MVLPEVIGHRGAAASAPENTLVSLRQAHLEGARWVEFDVKLTADNVPILMHDDRLGRTTNGRGKVAKTGWDDLQKLDAGGWFGPAFAGERVPSLGDALDLCADLGMGVNIELKPCPGRAWETARIVSATVDDHWPDKLPRPLFSSFERAALLAIREVRPDADCGFLCTRVPRRWQDEMARHGCSTLNVSHRWIREKHLRAAAELDLPVLTYTVNDPARARKLIRAGVRSVFTDNVRAVIEALAVRPAAA